MVTVSASHFHRPGGLLSMKSARENMDIIAACQLVGTYRGAAVMCGTTHRTVKRIIERAEAGGKTPDRAGRGHNYDLVAELAADRVAATKGRISAKRLLPAAKAAGYAGSARNFRRLVAEAKRTWRRDNHRGRRPAVWTPGEVLAIDWGSTVEGLDVSGLRKLYSLKPLPAIPGTRCGPLAEAGTRSLSGGAFDCSAVRCSVQYHAWPFRESDRPCGTRALS